jgi:hypothetical protein
MERGITPALYESRPPFMHSRTFVLSIDMLRRALVQLEEEPSLRALALLLRTCSTPQCQASLAFGTQAHTPRTHVGNAVQPTDSAEPKHEQRGPCSEGVAS